MLCLLKEAALLTSSLVPVSISGESGTGKERLARAIHRANTRAQQLFSSINRAPLPSAWLMMRFAVISMALSPVLTMCGSGRGQKAGLWFMTASLQVCSEEELGVARLPVQPLADVETAYSLNT